MSLSEKNSVVFAYESSVHSTNVLLSLDDQRKQDILCDVTILVEDQRFRAHKAVLAACSSYFLARIVGQVDADLIITLPEEVTLKGFSPLLQFAYTAKLILNKDNVSEVCKCAEFLGVHNIEESCFQFLKFKFLDFKLDQQECPRKKCCTQRCQKTNPKTGNVDDGDLEIDDEAEELEKEYIQTPDTKLCKDEENAKSSPALQDNANQTCDPVHLERGSVPSLSSQCPKYRKFQKAFGNDKVHTSESNSSIKDIQVPPIATFLEKEIFDNDGIQKAQECVPMQLVSKCEEAQVKMEQGEEGTEKKEESKRDSVTRNVSCPVEKMDLAAFPQNSPAPHGLNSVSFLHTCEQYGNLNFSSMQNNTVLAEKTVSGTALGNDKIESQDDMPSKVDLCTKEAANVTPAGDRSSVEREVAEHLAKGFWSDIYSTETCQIHLPPAAPKECFEPVYSGKKSECPWLGIRISESPEPCSQRTFTTLNSVNCPFISNLNTEGCSNSSEISSGDYMQGQQQEPCPYNYVISLGEDSETDTEGDSESCSAREQECEVKLPFNAQRIISLSRNDFQSFLKMHKLTPEQLDCIHDIRRRSKNRIAAQRCRKRKLDCIQNLESEIEKLQNEKENLLKERNHILSTLGETKQNLTGLCQQVCKEAALSHEQIQILAKYSSSDCPLSFLFPERERTPPSDSKLVIPPCTELADGLSGVTSTNEQSSCYQCVKSVCDAAYDQVQELHPVSVRTLEKTSLVEQCGQSSGITDFCQQMTDKCTTDE
ncbi:transcription regulator protein BACH1 [Falco biarmicus]|uniref:transcription regulator protein BACH1 n=1 Tax=Falco biarmicus TaxID=345155 RepID=UPI00247ADB88|nr:transcription regulator protein BACH1 isoform X1 [Falco peregrinus]XP_055657960.1 transcription regulator protein BACH1 isoform X1 [Falco peregrinus]XP_055657961.1 transcription regulator protein BACH1 isoform X1 [Falco peregrinus]XP_056183165.1 transcription regulator protein BACH1 [Falco biarmicus]XP_056183166.1 transcription regulator protein BACH1 [Falco biarmicus]